MTDICFVILHYNTIEDTLNCISSIYERLDVENFHIVVVDNESPNNTGAELEEKFRDNSKVTILLTKENLGFARGNNVGIHYAEEHVQPKFLVMLNSDTYLIQDDFYAQIEAEYQQSHFFVLGPQVINLKGAGKFQAIERKPLNREETKSFIRGTRYHLIVNYLGIAEILTAIRLAITKHKPQSVSANDVTVRKENVYLTGSCLIFSAEFLKEYHGLNPGTFMYFEEEILFHEMMRDGRTTAFSPDVKMYHNEVGATRKTIRNRRKANIFWFKNQLQSAKFYLSMLDSES